MAKKSAANMAKREEREMRRAQEQQRRYLRYGILSVFGLVVIGALVWLGTRPATAMGEDVAVGDYRHVPAGSDPGPYASDPPAGGKHYPSTFNPGFYNESDIETLPKRYEGSLVHNLEHGYVIFWYNCDADPNIDCDTLKQTIRDVMDRSGTDELIAFPWPSIEEPLVMTSWGKIMRFSEINPNQMAAFIRANLNKSPEPDAR